MFGGMGAIWAYVCNVREAWEPFGIMHARFGRPWSHSGLSAQGFRGMGAIPADVCNVLVALEPFGLMYARIWSHWKYLGLRKGGFSSL